MSPRSWVHWVLDPRCWRTKKRRWRDTKWSSTPCRTCCSVFGAAGLTSRNTDIQTWYHVYGVWTFVFLSVMMMDKDMNVYIIYIYDTLLFTVAHSHYLLTVRSSAKKIVSRFFRELWPRRDGNHPAAKLLDLLCAYGGFLKWYPFIAGWFVVENPTKNEWFGGIPMTCRNGKLHIRNP